MLDFTLSYRSCTSTDKGTTGPSAWIACTTKSTFNNDAIFLKFQSPPLIVLIKHEITKRGYSIQIIVSSKALR